MGRNFHQQQFKRQQQRKQQRKMNWREDCYMYYRLKMKCDLKKMSVHSMCTITVIKDNATADATAASSLQQNVSFSSSKNPSDNSQNSQKVAMKKKRVWFPEDENNEPHEMNPCDGFGGSLYRLITHIPIYYFQNNDNQGRILEGAAARKAARSERTALNKSETTDLLYREFRVPVEKGGCGGQWSVLETRLSFLVEPDWCMIGQFWRTLYGDAPRISEDNIDTNDDSSDSF
jgi:hypothetical protein